MLNNKAYYLFFLWVVGLVCLLPVQEASASFDFCPSLDYERNSQGANIHLVVHAYRDSFGFQYVVTREGLWGPVTPLQKGHEGRLLQPGDILTEESGDGITALVVESEKGQRLRFFPQGLTSMEGYAIVSAERLDYDPSHQHSLGVMVQLDNGEEGVVLHKATNWMAGDLVWLVTNCEGEVWAVLNLDHGQVGSLMDLSLYFTATEQMYGPKWQWRIRPLPDAQNPPEIAGENGWN